MGRHQTDAPEQTAWHSPSGRGTAAKGGVPAETLVLTRVALSGREPAARLALTSLATASYDDPPRWIPRSLRQNELFEPRPPGWHKAYLQRRTTGSAPWRISIPAIPAS